MLHETHFIFLSNFGVLFPIEFKLEFTIAVSSMLEVQVATRQASTNTVAANTPNLSVSETNTKNAAQ